MIARIWRGATRREDRAAYADYVARTGLTGYRSTPGNHGATGWFQQKSHVDGTAEWVGVQLDQTAMPILLGARLEQQKAKGGTFFVGNQLSALDIYWATFAALVQPLPPALCPMATAFRDFYTEKNPVVTAAVSPLLLEHRDFIYRQYLELPIVF